jgi:hypothetical protein
VVAGWPVSRHTSSVTAESSPLAIGLFGRFFDVADGPLQLVAQGRGDGFERERFGAGQRVRGTGMAGRIEQHGRHGIGDVVFSHRRYAPVARRAADDAIWSGKRRQQVGVEVVAHERKVQAQGSDMLLRRVVLPAVRERAVRGGAQE